MTPALFSSRNILVAFFVFFLAALIVLFANTSYTAQEEYVIKEFKIFHNEGGMENLDLSSYSVIQQDKLDFGFTSENVWLGFSIKDFLSHHESLNIEIENPAIREAELYYVSEDGRLVPYGHNRNDDFRSRRLVQHPDFIFSVFPDEDPS